MAYECVIALWHRCNKILIFGEKGNTLKISHFLQKSHPTIFQFCFPEHQVKYSIYLVTEIHWFPVLFMPIIRKF